MEGRWFVVRNSAIRVRPIISGPRSAVTSTAPGRSLRSAGKARSRSATEDTSTGSRRRPRAVAPDRALSRATAEKLFAGFTRDGYARQGRKQLLEQLQSFPFRVGGLPGEPGDVASWMSQIADETGGDGVARLHDDWNGLGCS